MKTIIEIENLSKSFGRNSILNGLTFSVEAGQSVALWGSNGAGKTTLIRCLLGLIDFEGSIRIDGLDVQTSGKSARRLLGYVPQEMALHDDLKVIEAAHFMAKLKGAPISACKEKLEDLNLLQHAQKRIRELSGGMKQRLALALALLNDPPILILDEPTSNLDSTSRQSLMDLLMDQKASGRTILFISHRPEEVTGLADRVLTLEMGRVLFDRCNDEPANFESLIGSAS